MPEPPASATELVDHHLAALDRALVGRRRARRDLLVEVRAGLVDALEAELEHGSDAVTVARRVLRDFGDVHEVAPAFQRELALSDLQRSAWLVMAVLLAQPILWGRVSTVGDAGALFRSLDQLVGWAAAAVLGVAVLVLLGCGIGLRYVDVDGRMIRSAATAALGACATFAILGIVMWVASGAGPVTLLWLAGNLLAPLTAVAVGARRCRAAS